MSYYIDLFSPETYQAFRSSDQTISGFRMRQRNAATNLQPGDKLVCYLTRLSRWIGLLEVSSKAFEDTSPRFQDGDDPFIVRVRVRPLVLLDFEHAVPMKADSIWSNLSFTKGLDKSSVTWTGKVRGSLVKLNDADGAVLEEALLRQVSAPVSFPLDEDDKRKLVTHRVKRPDKTVEAVVPDEHENGESDLVPVSEVRESIQIQSLLARIGAAMGHTIWIPKSDRSAVLAEWGAKETDILNQLPLNYDEVTIKTIEQIDVLWLRRTSIVRAFEVEHTTSIYSGILRMADLLALQPNMDIRLHIVAPSERRDKVFREIQRPVFTLLEKGPLAENCTFLSYDSVREISGLRFLHRMSDTVVDDYAEEAEY